MDIYASARKHGISDVDIEHAVNHAVVAGDQEDGKIHAMRMRSSYESFLDAMGEADG